MEFNFISPDYLFFLLAIPVLVAFHFFTLKGIRGKALTFANFEAISKIKGVDFFSKNIIILSLSVIIIFLASLALAGLTITIEVDTNQYSTVLAIDSSQSMEATDFYPSRLEAAKSISIDFVESAPFKSKFGVVSFSGSTVVVSSVSDDIGKVVDSLENIELSRVGGTDLFEAVATSTNLLKWEDSKVIVLLSDGQINVGTVDEAISYANEYNVIVHTVSIGTNEGGETSFGVSKLDENVLNALAFNTGGEHFSAQTIEDLKDILENIFLVTNRKVDVNLSSYLIIAVIILFMVEYFLLNTRYKSFP